MTPAELRDAGEELVLIIGEPPCDDCGEHHVLNPAAEATCRRARVVRRAALDTSRAIADRLRRESLQSSQRMR